MPVFKDLSGQRFGMLTVLSEHEKKAVSKRKEKTCNMALQM